MIEPTFTVKIKEESSTYAEFVYEPLSASFGNSVGNAMRRTLLSSIESAAISHVKFAKATHFFATIEGVKESVLDIVLNLKQLRFKTNGDGPFQIHLSVKGDGKVYGKDVDGEVEVVNKDLYIAQVTGKNASLEIDAIVQKGYGYESSEEKEEKAGYIRVDSIYSPITKVNFVVQEARVGRKSNYDRLILQVWTDGTISPVEAVKQAASTLSTIFKAIVENKPQEEAGGAESALIAADKTSPKVYETIIDELNLPSRVINALLREHIETVKDLVERGREELTNLKGVGKKSIDLIEEELKKMGVELI